MYHSPTSIRRPNKDGLPVRTAMRNENIKYRYRMSLGQNKMNDRVVELKEGHGSVLDEFCERHNYRVHNYRVHDHRVHNIGHGSLL